MERGPIMEKPVMAIILAAGQGTRMKSRIPKVLHSVLGRTMVERVIEATRGAGIQRLVAVVDHASDGVRDHLERIGGVIAVVQEKQLGTGHAVMMAVPQIDEEGDVLVLYGDTPLVESQDILHLLEMHRRENASASLFTADVDDPTGYGRVIRDESGAVSCIVEQRDATDAQLRVKEVLGGVLCFSSKHLLLGLNTLDQCNAQGEYQLPQVISHLIRERLPVRALKTPDSERILGVNTRKDLASAEGTARRRVVERMWDNGVTVVDPPTTHIWETVEVGPDTVIGPFSILEGDTTVGEGSLLGPGAHLRNVVAGRGVTVVHSFIEESRLEDGVKVGPFSHIRPGCFLGARTRIGNFAEVKNSTIGKETKINHHSYTGDSIVGEGVNIGAGVVTVNYDGMRKHKTVIEDQAFVGCNTNLVAPVTVGERAYVAAGSTITKDVAPGSLGVSRSRQRNVKDWVKRSRERFNGKQKEEV